MLFVSSSEDRSLRSLESRRDERFETSTSQLKLLFYFTLQSISLTRVSVFRMISGTTIPSLGSEVESFTTLKERGRFVVALSLSFRSFVHHRSFTLFLSFTVPLVLYGHLVFL